MQSLESLTPRQREILQLIDKGQNTKQIALSLNISVKTVETHRTQLMDRLQIHNIASLVRYAIRNGLIHLEDKILVTVDEPPMWLRYEADETHISA